MIIQGWCNLDVGRRMSERRGGENNLESGQKRKLVVLTNWVVRIVISPHPCLQLVMRIV